MREPFARVLLALAAVIFSAAFAFAQSETPEQQKVRVISEEIAALMTDLEQRAASYPETIQQLEQGQIKIEQANETVQGLIGRLNEITGNMEDGKEFDQAIKAYIKNTTDLIAEAQGSNNDAMKSAIPNLQKTLDNLKQDDAERAQTVVEARNLIRELERNKETLAFFVKVGEVQKAAELIRTTVGEFKDIVVRGKQLASRLAQPTNP